MRLLKPLELLSTLEPSPLAVLSLSVLHPPLSEFHFSKLENSLVSVMFL